MLEHKRGARIADIIAGRLRMFGVAFGCVIGSGWVVMLGKWLSAAGPGGVVVGMLAGGTVMLACSAAYAELLARYPISGGEFTFALQVFGRGPAFFVGWMTTLSLLAVVAFEAAALPWVIEALLPAFTSPTLYTAFGTSVRVHALLLGLGGTVGKRPTGYWIVADCRG